MLEACLVFGAIECLIPGELCSKRVFKSLEMIFLPALILDDADLSNPEISTPATGQPQSRYSIKTPASLSSLSCHAALAAPCMKGVNAAWLILWTVLLHRSGFLPVLLLGGDLEAILAPFTTI